MDNPFLTKESEEDFIRRGQSMISLYYKPGDPGAKTRKDFEFEGGRKMSKTQFWGIIYIYYTEQLKAVSINLQGFLNIVQAHFGASVASDRTAIMRNVALQHSFFVHLKHSFEFDGSKGRDQKKYRSQYQFVVRRWEEK